jgi:RimJ/RimL family protein N-acetyltransferase
MRRSLRQLATFVLRCLVAEYQLNWIYYIDLPTRHEKPEDRVSEPISVRRIDSREQFSLARDSRIRDHAWYLDKDAYVYGIYEDGELVSICAFWKAGHPRMPRRFSALKQSEAVMVDLLTTPQSRGKGHALAITQFAEKDLFRRGYTRLWTWVWHSNHPSMRVFAKAGWKYSHFLIELQFHGLRKSFSFRLDGNRLRPK